MQDALLRRKRRSEQRMLKSHSSPPPQPAANHGPSTYTPCVWDTAPGRRDRATSPRPGTPNLGEMELVFPGAGRGLVSFGDL